MLSIGARVASIQVRRRIKMKMEEDEEEKGAID